MKMKSSLGLATLVAALLTTPLALAQGEGSDGGAMQGEGMMDQGKMSGMMAMMQMMQRCNEMMAGMTEQMDTPEPPEMQDRDG